LPSIARGEQGDRGAIDVEPVHACLADPAGQAAVIDLAALEAEHCSGYGAAFNHDVHRRRQHDAADGVVG
jgi:hypothetical protein